jgi:hypothetical protein
MSWLIQKIEEGRKSRLFKQCIFTIATIENVFTIDEGFFEYDHRFKGPWHEIFDLWFFSSNNFPWAPDAQVKAFLNMD